jgi:hypothetical protein
VRTVRAEKRLCELREKRVEEREGSFKRWEDDNRGESKRKVKDTKL